MEDLYEYTKALFQALYLAFVLWPHTLLFCFCFEERKTDAEDLKEALKDLKKSGEARQLYKLPINIRSIKFALVKYRSVWTSYLYIMGKCKRELGWSAGELNYWDLSGIWQRRNKVVFVHLAFEPLCDKLTSTLIILS